MLHATGRLLIDVDHPELYVAFGQRVADGHIATAKQALSDYEFKFNTTPSALPDRPDQAAVERWLRFVRLKFL
jgi:hypothetical protein